MTEAAARDAMGADSPLCPTAKEAAGPAQFIAQRISDEHVESREVWENMNRLLDQKLYHPFMTELERFVKTSDEVLDLSFAVSLVYNIFSPAFLTLINPGRFIDIFQTVLFGRRRKEKRLSREQATEVLALVKYYFEHVRKATDDAAAASVQLLTVLQARVLVAAGDVNEADKLLFRVLPREYMKNRVGIPIPFNLAYHLACSEVHEARGDLNELYDSFLLYLAYLDPNSLSAEEQLDLGVCLARTGLLADNMFDFGGLLSSPFLPAVREASPSLYELVVLAGEGDLARFAAMAGGERGAELAALFSPEEAAQLRRKLSLAALVDLAFCSADRTLTPTQIAAACDVRAEDAERLVMTAVSKQLLRARIDGVAEKVFIDWVRPRVINPSRLTLVQKKLTHWMQSVGGMIRTLEDTYADLHNSTGVVFS